MDVGRDWAEVGAVEPTADGEQYPDVEALDRSQRRPVHPGGDGHVSEHRPERDVDERRCPTRPTSPEGARPAAMAVRGSARWQGTATGRARRGTGSGRGRPTALRRGRAGAPRAPVRRRRWTRPRLRPERWRPGRPGHGRGRPPRRTRTRRAREDEVGCPLGACLLHAGQHGERRQPAEQLAIAEHRCFRRRCHREAFADGSDLLLGRLPTGPGTGTRPAPPSPATRAAPPRGFRALVRVRQRERATAGSGARHPRESTPPGPARRGA